MSLELPTMLSFDRKLETSDGLMFSGQWADKNNEAAWQPIGIIPRQNRSTQSAEGIADAKKIQPNPVASSNDDANLPLTDNTLKLSFTLRIIGGVGQPFACNHPEFAQAIEEKVDKFKQTAALQELALRYAYNIANGRFLWRNRVCAERVSIVVSIEGVEPSLEFNGYDFDLNCFDKNVEVDNLRTLSEYIARGLKSENDYVFMRIDAYVKLGNGQHVYPSQEMNMEEKRKVLFQIDGQAAMHNVKIGNALRTIDNWYEQNAKFPIAIEPYGAVTHRGQAYRKSTNDLYTLMVQWVNDKAIDTEAQTYVVANLIRGGVFSKGSKD